MKRLYEGIKEAIALTDLEILQNQKVFINILSDLDCFEGCNAYKAIIRAFQTEEIIKKILELPTAKNKTDIAITQNYIENKVSSDFGFRGELIHYVFQSITYALGLTNEPYSPYNIENLEVNKCTGRWLFYYRKGKEQWLSIKPDGTAISQSKTEYRWELVADQISIFIDGMVKYSGHLISEDIITGTAYSKLYNRSWEWRAVRYLPSLIIDNLIDKFWVIQNDISEIEDIEVEFKSNNVLLSQLYGKGNWWLENGTLIMHIANSYIRYEAKETSEGISGIARNKSGISWNFNLKTNKK